MSMLERIVLPHGLKELSHADLDIVAEEVRALILDVCSKNGGHLAPSLGVVELTISLLRMFDPEHDKVVWDVGHQSYAWKILTDRKDRFHTLRQHGGISGFIKPSESRYDSFAVGHTSTSISAGLGITIGSEVAKTPRRVVTVIGDGAMTAGMAFEALNNLGHLKKNQIVILNDNEMSISPNVGAFSSYLSRLMHGEFATKVKREVQGILEHAPLGEQLLHIAKKMEEGVIGFFTPGILFEELGLSYIGPVNGHKTRDLEKALKNAINQTGPVIVHVSTKKGKGYIHAEQNPSRFHGVSSFDIGTGQARKFGTSAKAYTDIFGETLIELADASDKVVGITAAMRDGTGLSALHAKYPNRFFDVGIAEQHAVTFAAGLAISGARPYVSIYSTFYQRAYDQIIHDVALQNLPVVLCFDRAGLVGEDGPTHHGAYDISYLRPVPNMTIMMPKSGTELREMLRLTPSVHSPVAIRYPRGAAHDYPELPEQPVVIGEPEIVHRGASSVAIVSAGHIFSEAYGLWKQLGESGVDATLVNLRFLKPLKAEILLEAIAGASLVITVEEGSVKGGAGEEVQSLLMDSGSTARVKRFGLPDTFIDHGNADKLRASITLTADTMFEAVKPLI